MTADARGECRVCGSSRIDQAGTVEYLEGFPRAVFDCADCGCRFTSHEASIYQRLHASPAISYYLDYRELAQKCRWLFDGGNVDGLKRLLCESAKYKFVIDAIEQEPPAARILELGSSRGYLTSCFILQGRDVLGVDVSPEAVSAAREAFGDHFAVPGSARAESGGPFDVIYHVGTIGCVPDPIGLTRALIARLRPGGRLLFNAPNRSALRDPDQLWFDSAPPPELATLFPEGFFRRQFSDVAEVREVAHALPSDASLAIGLRQRLGQRWTPPAPKSIDGPLGQGWSRAESRWMSLLVRAILKAARLTGLNTLARTRPSEYGLFVEMVAKA